jgi:hypothetical protein
VRRGRLGGFAVAIAAILLAPARFSGGGADLEQSALANDAPTVYVCPMHPEVTSDRPGLCPKCHMKLVSKPTPRSRSSE